MEQTIKERLNEYIKIKGLSVNKFEKACGLSQGFVKNIGKSIGTTHLGKILQTYTDLSQDWLLYGKGDMLIPIPTTDVDPQKPKEDKDVLMVPVINLDARGGFQANEAVDVPQYVVGQLPFSTNVAQPGDFVIEIHGDSMYPRYPSGSYILLREIPMWREYLELSIPYVLELGDGRRLAKIVMKGDDADHFTLHSVNPDFQDTTIAASFINKVFMVVMMLKKETV